MNAPRFFTWPFATLLVAAGLQLCVVASAADRPPNIIFVLTDDMGFGDVGCNGGTFVPTPNIDRLAAEGLRFTRFYCGSPVCSPSRTAFTTGMFPARWSVHTYLDSRAKNREREQANFLDAKAPSLARALKAAGYATGHFGKWHMGGGRDVKDAPAITAFGFDEYASTWESPDPHPDLTAGNWIWSDKDKVKRWDRTAFFVDKTLDFLRRNKGKPCYVNCWPDDVHTPWVPSQERLSEFPNGPEEVRKFKGVLAEYDKQIGRLLDGLKELGIERETLVLFTSDNGPLPTFQSTRAAGLRGSKISLYEGGIRMPFIARWTGRVPAGKVDEETVMCGIDFFPSLCAIAGAPLPDGVKLDGENLSAALLGQPATRAKPLLWEYGWNEKYSFPKGADRSPPLLIMDGSWKLLANHDGSGVELYDINADRKESKNVAGEKPGIVKRLSRQLMEWRKSLP
jgi:arylsulfatase A-like enzyme